MCPEVLPPGVVPLLMVVVGLVVVWFLLPAELLLVPDVPEVALLEVLVVAGAVSVR